MEQQEIDKLLAECKQITDDFRASLKPAVDENGQIKMVDERNFKGKKTGKKIELLETTSEQVENYINKIQKMLKNEALESIQKYGIVDCSGLYITGDFHINKSLPYSSFNGSIFHGKVDFRGATFYGKAYFKDTVFSSKTNLNGTTFFEIANFNGSVFSDDVDFTATAFSDRTFFNGTTFSKKTYFNHSTFTGCVYFIRAIFLYRIDFSSTTFFKSVDFSGTIFSGWANFKSIKFYDNVNFTNAKFKDTTYFEKTLFTSPPICHNTELHPSTSFGQPEDIARNFGRCKTQQDYMAYRALKHHMSNVHAKLEESIFFALEQRTKRNIDGKDFLKNWSNYLISLFYDHISGYGQNTAKPIIILLISGFIIFPAIYWALDDILGRSIIVNVVKELKEQNIWGWYQSLPIHLGYSLQSIFNPLVFFNKDSAFIATNPFIRFVSSIQSMFTIAVFALWLLAVRNRFQKGS